jgi:hypothetical protein
MHCYALIVNAHNVDALAGRETTSLGRGRRRYGRLAWLGGGLQPELNRLSAS